MPASGRVQPGRTDAGRRGGGRAARGGYDRQMAGGLCGVEGAGAWLPRD